MSRVPPRVAVLFAAAILLPALTAVSCGSEPSGVAVGAASRGTVDEIVEAPGSVTARAAATVTSPADGTLAELRVTDGDRVSKGQVLAVIDSPAAQQRLAAAEQALNESPRGVSTGGGTAQFAAVQRRTDAQAGTSFDQARAAARKVTDPTLRDALLEQVDAAQEQYAAASAAAAAALRAVQEGVAGLGQALDALTSAQRLQARQAYQLAVAGVDALTLHAPVAGVVQLGGTGAAGGSSLTDLLSSGSVPSTPPAASGAGSLPGVDAAVPVGAVVSVGTPIVTVVDTGRLGLVAEVDETDVLLVKPGGPATAELDAATGATYRATVRAVDQLPTTSARGGVAYRIRLDLGKGTYDDGRPAPTPRPGMSAVVRLRVGRAEDAVTVPASAIVNADGQDTVWAVRSGRAERVPVTLGVQGEDVVQVTSGLRPGQRIVVSGADRVHQGDKAS